MTSVPHLENTDEFSAVRGPGAVDELLANIKSSSVFSGSPRLFQLLEYLVVETDEGRADRIKGFTIAQEVYGRTDPEDAQTSTIVSVEARRLRRRLKDYYETDGQQDTIRISIPKGAYVPSFEYQSGPDVEDSAGPDHRSVPTTQTAPTRRRLFLYGVGVSTLAILALLVISWIAFSTLKPNGNAPTPLVVVVPFDNLTQENALTLDLSHDITAELSGLPDLDVIAQSSIDQLQGAPITLETAASSFGATHVVYGTLRGHAPEFRISVELVDVPSGKLLWAGRFDNDLDDPLKAQLEIARQVARALPYEISPLPTKAGRPDLATTTDTLALYKQALDIANPPSDPQRLTLAEIAFQKVIEADPNFAGGHAGVAYISSFKMLFAPKLNTQAARAEAIQLAQKALTLDPNQPLALNASAFLSLLSGDYDGAVAVSARAVVANPNDPYAAAYHGFILAADGAPEQGIAHVKHALRLDPLNARAPYLNILGTIHLQAGNYQAAIEAFRENQSRNGPNSPGMQAALVAAYVGNGNRDEARRLLERLPQGYIEGAWLTWRIAIFRTKKDALVAPELIATLSE